MVTYICCSCMYLSGKSHLSYFVLSLSFGLVYSVVSSNYFSAPVAFVGRLGINMFQMSVSVISCSIVMFHSDVPSTTNELV